MTVIKKCLTIPKKKAAEPFSGIYFGIAKIFLIKALLKGRVKKKPQIIHFLWIRGGGGHRKWIREGVKKKKI